jgi:hypothetical protein
VATLSQELFHGAVSLTCRGRSKVPGRPTLLVFLVWTAIVLAWYFAYVRKHSHLGRHEHVGLIKDEPVG